MNNEENEKRVRAVIKYYTDGNILTQLELRTIGLEH